MNEIILPVIASAGIYNSLLAYKNKTVSKQRKTVMFEIELPIEAGGISYIDDESHKINENLIICAKPGQLRHTRLPFKCYYIHLIVNEGELYEFLSAMPNYIEIDNTEEIRQLFASIYEYHSSGVQADKLMLHGFLLRLVYLISHSTIGVKKNHIPKANNQNTIKNTIEYINKNLSSDLTLNSLAERASFNPIYFHRLFKSSTGKTLHEYITEQRIKKSVDLLISTDMNLSAIAYECGFSSQSYFSTAFKKYTGAPPREYAKSLINKYDK